MIRGMARVLAFGLAALTAACGGAPQQAAKTPPQKGEIVVEEFMVEADDKGTALYLRNKHVAEMTSVSPQKVVLFVHGASYPGHTSFDMPIDGMSWMDWMARRGYDVYSIDLRGYGRSTRPAALEQPPEANPPQVDTTMAVADVSRAIDFVTSRRSLQKLVLVGWSWGATVAGAYSTYAPNKIERLVLYAPQWLRDGVPAPDVNPAQVGAWRSAAPSEARERWLRNVPDAKREAVLPKSTFNAWAKATLATDPDAAKHGGVRAPNGVVADALRFWAAGKPRWEPSRVSVPTLVIQGEWDAEAPPAMGQAVFSRLTSAPVRRYVMIGEATHAALLEQSRVQLYRAVQAFLEEGQ